MAVNRRDHLHTRNFLTNWENSEFLRNAHLGGVRCEEQNRVLRTPYLLTYSMVQSPSWEANWFAASQEIPRILWNPKVHYRTHKRPPTVLILGQPNPVHIPTSHLLEIHPNIIHPSMPRSPQWPPSLRFPHQDPICLPLLELSTPYCSKLMIRLILCIQAVCLQFYN